MFLFASWLQQWESLEDCSLEAGAWIPLSFTLAGGDNSNTVKLN